MEELLLDVTIDSIKALPILFLVYLLLEYLENKSSNELDKKIIKYQKHGPLVGSLIGCLPQCGFSMAASKLFSKHLITVGTLMAVFLSTSDEALVILLTQPDYYQTILSLIIIKILIGCSIGLLIDKFINTKIKIENNIILHEESKHENILLAAVKRTIKIFIFIFIINLLLSTAIMLIGEDNLAKILMNNTMFQPILAALVGIIPNCAASILLAQLFINETINFGSLVAGLCSGAGLGLVVLFKENKDYKQNIKILLSLLTISSIIGIIITLI
ncbi:MAG: putative manganese transporter [Erysipelotrichaceae bacterium]